MEHSYSKKYNNAKLNYVKNLSDLLSTTATI